MKRKRGIYDEVGRAILKATGLKQRALGKKWKTSQQNVSRRLRGIGAITVANLSQLAKRCKLRIVLQIGEIKVTL